MNGQITRVAVVGAGTMGRGIAQVFAQKGFHVSLFDSSASQLEKALKNIEKNLTRQVEKNRISPSEREQTLRNIHMHQELNICREAEFAIEAVNEEMEVKRNVLVKLDELCPSDSILATNTSSISITCLASATQRPDRIIGMHFMNPVPVMKLVEIVRGHITSQQTVSAILLLVRRLDKIAVEVNDSPGFVSNRVLMPMINEAIFCVYENVGSPQAIDTVMQLGMNHPMGPLTLADLIGLDVCLNIMETLYDGFNDSKYRPCPLLKKMVSAGKLGRKSGEGFYRYTREGE